LVTFWDITAGLLEKEVENHTGVHMLVGLVVFPLQISISLAKGFRVGSTAIQATLSVTWFGLQLFSFPSCSQIPPVNPEIFDESICGVTGELPLLDCTEANTYGIFEKLSEYETFIFPATVSNDSSAENVPASIPEILQTWSASTTMYQKSSARCA